MRLLRALRPLRHFRAARLQCLLALPVEEWRLDDRGYVILLTGLTRRADERKYSEEAGGTFMLLHLVTEEGRVCRDGPAGVGAMRRAPRKQAFRR